jgi:ABC-type Fe3+-hydroxamate transport system substrate-binding protein
VGGTKNPKVHRIIELEPDLVLMNAEENRREDADALVAAGVPCHVSFPKTSLETAEVVRSIGSAVRRVNEAEAIARDIEARSARVHASAAGRATVSFAYLIWRDPLMTVNADTFVDALLRQAGGDNVFGRLRARYPTISVDELRAANPDLVLLSTEPFPFAERHIDELAESARLPHERFRVVDGELLSWHGSRTPRGVDYAEQVITGASR